MLTPASVASVLVTTFAAVAVVVADDVTVVVVGVETGDKVELFSDGAS